MSGLIDAIVNHMPHVVVLPIDFPGLGGARGIRDVRRLSPASKIVVLSGSMDPTEELEVLRRGAKGYSGPVGTDVLFKMVDKVQQGEVWAGRKTIGALLDEYQAAGDLAPRESTIAQTDLQRLTSRERQILRFLSEGASNKEIAATLFIAEGTVKNHLTNILGKLGVRDRTQAALKAKELGLV